MKIFSKWISLETQEKYQEIALNDFIEAIVFESRVSDGIVLIFSQHTTIGLYLSNNDKYLKDDLENFLDEKIPNDPNYLHNVYGGNNASAHLKNVLIGSSLTLAVNDGELLLGEWQNIFLGEFDGPRKRKILVKVVGE